MTAPDPSPIPTGDPAPSPTPTPPPAPKAGGAPVPRNVEGILRASLAIIFLVGALLLVYLFVTRLRQPPEPPRDAAD